MKTAVRQCFGGIFHNCFIQRQQLRAHIFFRRVRRLRALRDPAQIYVHGQQPLRAESRVRAGKKVAVDEVEIAARPLGAAHIIQRQQNAPEHLCVQMPFAVRVQAAGRHGRQMIDGHLRLRNAVRRGESAKKRVVPVQDLNLHKACDTGVAVPQDLVVMLFHMGAPFPNRSDGKSRCLCAARRAAAACALLLS